MKRKDLVMSLVAVAGVAGVPVFAHAGSAIEIGGAAQAPKLTVLEDTGNSLTIEATSDVSVDADGNVVVAGNVALKGANWSATVAPEYGADGFGVSVDGEYVATHRLTLRSKVARPRGERLDVAVGVKVEYARWTLDSEVGAKVEGDFSPHAKAELALHVKGPFEVYAGIEKSEAGAKASAGVRYKKKLK